MLLWLIVWVAVFGLLTGWVAETKNRNPWDGFLLGALLGPLGLLAFGLTSPAVARVGTKLCPRCAERVKSAAKVCRFCGHEFAEEPASAQPPTPARTQSTWDDHLVRNATFIVVGVAVLCLLVIIIAVAMQPPATMQLSYLPDLTQP